MGYLLGIDLGSSSVKASLLDAETGQCAGSDFFPKDEQRIDSPEPGFAEQDPQAWKKNACEAIRSACERAQVKPDDIAAIGISYQMHGLVCVDKNQAVLRPAIIWCDSRAVPYGESAFREIGAEKCLQHLLNSPGNFTAAKLAWVKEHEPEIYRQIDKIMLPGDWLAMELSGGLATTPSGLSEGMFWDFKDEGPCGFLLDHFGFEKGLLPKTVPNFGPQAQVSPSAAEEFGLKAGIPIAYRGGDQPNNALSLNVLEPGEIAATAGTSGVVYGVTDKKEYDPQSRFNTFLHVNHSADAPRLGQLLCINGTGILNAWTRRLMGNPAYKEMDTLAQSASPGADGLIVLPFGNGAERMLGNRSVGGSFANLDFNRHGQAEICRAVQEGIAFAFQYGMDIMRSAGMELDTIRAGFANMFLSPLFGEVLSNVSGAAIELYDTDGALGAARGAGVGSGEYKSYAEAFESLEKKGTIEPGSQDYSEPYDKWKKEMQTKLEDEES